MITRRASLLGLGVLSAMPRTALAAMSIPRPAIFTNEIWQRYRCCWNGQPWSDFMRAEFLRQMNGALIPAERTEATVRRTLGPRYTLELAYDGIRPDMKKTIETELCDALVSEIVCEIVRAQAYRLVALDGFLHIDESTFQPCIAFYADWNACQWERGTHIRRLPS